MYLAVLASVALFLSVVSADDDPVIAFSVALRTNQTLGRGEIVVYKDVYLNDGNGYNTDTGIFTAPKDGVYLFHISGLSIRSQVVDIAITHNGNNKVAAYGYDTSENSGAATAVILSVKAGDRIYVSAVKPSQILSTGHIGINRFTTFLGYRITRDERGW